MENLTNKFQEAKPLELNEEIKSFLLQTSKWCKFLAIVGYVSMGLLVLFAILMIIGLSVIGSSFGMGESTPVALAGLLYIAIAVLYYFPVTYMYKFSVKIKQGILSNEDVTVTTGFKNLKSLFKFLGIMTIVILSVYVLSMIIMIPTLFLMGNSL